MKKQSRKTIFLMLVVFSVCMSITGCEEELKSSQEPGKKKIYSLMPKAEAIVKKALNSPDPRIRAKAVEVVGHSQNAELINQAVRLLGDPYVPVRFAAILTIADLKFSPAEPAIRKLMMDNDENCRIAAVYTAESLEIISDSLPIIKKAVMSKNQNLRANAALILGKTDKKEALETLHWIRNASDSEDQARYEAVLAIAKIGDKSIYPKIWTMLISAYNDVRLMGVEAMGQLGTDKAREALYTMLNDDVNEVRVAAAGQLGGLGDTAGEPAVLKVFTSDEIKGWEKDDKNRIRALAATAIGAICTEKLQKYLPRLLNDDSVLVQLATARAVFNCAEDKTGF